MKIKSVESVYTGGGVYIFWGELEDGNFFLTSDDGYVDILDESPEDFDKSLYIEWQDEHRVLNLTDEERMAFLDMVCDELRKVNGRDISDDEIEDYRHDWWNDYNGSSESEEAAEEPTEPKQVTIREFINLYNAELQKMFDGDEEAHIYGYDIALEWNGYKVNLGDGAIPTNALIPALEEIDSEWDGIC